MHKLVTKGHFGGGLPLWPLLCLFAHVSHRVGYTSQSLRSWQFQDQIVRLWTASWYSKFPNYQDFRIPCSYMWKRIPHTLWQYSPHIQQVKFSLSSAEHALHLCLFKALSSLKHLRHCMHLKLLSLLWILRCVFKVDEWLKHFLHWVHL